VLTTPQQRPPESTRRPNWDVVYVPEEDEDEEGAAEVTVAEDVLVETRRAREEAQSLETYERHPEPVIVSLEENIPTAAQRHEAFHKKVTAPTAPVAAQPTRRSLLNLSNRSELQRAFVLQEVLGKAKGLEPS
jgi:hypothetical protein